MLACDESLSKRIGEFLSSDQHHHLVLSFIAFSASVVMANRPGTAVGRVPEHLRHLFRTSACHQYRELVNLPRILQLPSRQCRVHSI